VQAGPSRSGLRSLGFLVALVLLSACRVDVIVDIDVQPDGSGVVVVDVVFDPDVIAAVPDLADHLRLDDLEEAGWGINLFAADEGTLRVRGERDFTSIEQLASILEGIDGPGGIFQGAGLNVDRRDENVTYRFHLDVSLDTTVVDLVDPAIAEALNGEPFGVPTAELEQRSGGPLDEVVTLTVRARIPDDAGEGQVEGSWTLAEEGGRRLKATGVVVDEDIRAADAAAADARAAVPTAVKWLLVWWGVLGAAAVAILWSTRRRSLR
jgi:hypothetical protein